MTRPGLQDDLEHVRTVFVDASHALRLFVHTSQRGIEHQASVLTEVIRKFSAARASELQLEPGPGKVQVKLTTNQVELVKQLLSEQADIATRFPSMLRNMALIYLVALFDAYLSDVFQAVLKARPEMLRSGRQLTYETILAFEDRQSLIAAMAAREIHGVAHKSLSEQLRYYDERFGVSLAGRATIEVGFLVELVARRNLLVHNAGVVNSIYRDAVADAPHADGEQLSVDEPYWESAAQQVADAVDAIDAGLRVKFCQDRASPDAAALSDANRPSPKADSSNG